ncbi:MAG: transcription/translation regulatory transformer protein RfaH, partial [Gammaproteobacteria bacterium]|nr:transcription/translation regulatory transformer protein RfaH [Gammaproteobacteria bacterium]
SKEKQQADKYDWYLVYTKPRQEKTALENLERQGYYCYLPMAQLKKRVRGKYTIVVEPFFPRYLFLRCDEELKTWAPIRSTVGVAKLVIFGDKPAKVSQQLINLIESQANDGVIETGFSNFEKGQRVRIIDGVMKDYEAIFIAKSSEERVMILLDIVGKTARLSIDVNQLELVAD